MKETKQSQIAIMLSTNEEKAKSRQKEKTKPDHNKASMLGSMDIRRKKATKYEISQLREHESKQTSCKNAHNEENETGE